MGCHALTYHENFTPFTGVWKNPDFVSAVATGSEIPLKICRKANHLGNVMVVISDKRKGQDEYKTLANLDFSTGTAGANPINGAVLNSVGNSLEVTPGTGGGGAEFTILTTAGQPYEISVDVSLPTGTPFITMDVESPVGNNIFSSSLVTDHYDMPIPVMPGNEIVISFLRQMMAKYSI